MEYNNTDNCFKKYVLFFTWINSDEHDGRTDEAFYFSADEELKDFVKENAGINILISRAFKMIDIDLNN